MESWIHVDIIKGKGNKELDIIIEPNNDNKDRSTSILVETPTIKKILKILQKGNKIMNDSIIIAPISWGKLDGKYQAFKNGEPLNLESTLNILNNNSESLYPNVQVVSKIPLFFMNEYVQAHCISLLGSIDDGFIGFVTSACVSGAAPQLKSYIIGVNSSGVIVEEIQAKPL